MLTTVEGMRSSNRIRIAWLYLCHRIIKANVDTVEKDTVVTGVGNTSEDDEPVVSVETVTDTGDMEMFTDDTLVEKDVTTTEGDASAANNGLLMKTGEDVLVGVDEPIMKVQTEQLTTLEGTMVSEIKDDDAKSCGPYSFQNKVNDGKKFSGFSN
ncbi:hypothetical protein QVD17_36489 [Tagetes erecta]|uniref:Uncharacterized protein n=1 Tax=Tagetes erecta TaxID=13708 RepID=A0AAD8JU86_TARER|nr:hypothetical protein QVD17_36489 [Tagetes erecta]